MATTTQIYHGHRNHALPYSVVVRDGTFGQVRERTEAAIREAIHFPFATRGAAEQARQRLDPALRGFTMVIKFGGE